MSHTLTAVEACVMLSVYDNDKVSLNDIKVRTEDGKNVFIKEWFSQVLAGTAVALAIFDIVKGKEAAPMEFSIESPYYETKDLQDVLSLAIEAGLIKNPEGDAKIDIGIPFYNYVSAENPDAPVKFEELVADKYKSEWTDGSALALSPTGVATRLKEARTFAAAPKK